VSAQRSAPILSRSKVDVEIHLDTRPAGLADDLSRTVDYREIFDICRSVVEGPSRQLIETLAESIATAMLERSGGRRRHRGRGPRPQTGSPASGRLDHAAIEITRRRER